MERYSDRYGAGRNYESIYPSMEETGRNNQRFRNVPLSHLTASPKPTSNKYLRDLPKESERDFIRNGRDRLSRPGETNQNEKEFRRDFNRETNRDINRDFSQRSTELNGDPLAQLSRDPLNSSAPSRNPRDLYTPRDYSLKEPFKPLKEPLIRNHHTPPLARLRSPLKYSSSSKYPSNSRIDQINRDYTNSGPLDGYSPIKSLNGSYSSKAPSSIYRVLDSSPKSAKTYSSNRISKPRQREGYFSKLRRFLGGLDIPMEPKEKKRVTFDTNETAYNLDDDEVDELVQKQKRIDHLNQSRRLNELENEVIDLQARLKHEKEKNNSLRNDLKVLEKSYEDKLYALNSEISDIKRQNRLQRSKDSELELENSQLIKKNKEISRKMQELQEEIEYKLKRIEEQESSMKKLHLEQEQSLKALQSKLNHQSQQLYEKEEYLQSQQTDLEYRAIELKEAEAAMKRSEIENSLRNKLNKIKESIELVKFDLSKENLRIRTMLDRNIKDYHRYNLASLPLDAASTSYDKILDNIESEIIYIRKTNDVRVLDEESIKNNDELIKTLKAHLKTSKEKAESKIKDYDSALLREVPKFDNTDILANSIYKIYAKKQKSLRKLEKINEVLTRLTVLEEYHEDSKVLRSMEKDGMDINQYYNSIKREIERKFIL